MSTYVAELPEVFPCCITTSSDDVRRWVEFLMNGNLDGPRSDVSNGSSFAVTVDAPKGQWRLWLSYVSLLALKKEYSQDMRLVLGKNSSDEGA